MGRRLLLDVANPSNACAQAAQRAAHVAGVVATTLVDLRDADTVAAIARQRWLGRVAAFAYASLPGLADALTFRVADVAPLDAMSSDQEINAILKRDPLIGRRRACAARAARLRRAVRGGDRRPPRALHHFAGGFSTSAAAVSAATAVGTPA